MYFGGYFSPFSQFLRSALIQSWRWLILIKTELTIVFVAMRDVFQWIFFSVPAVFAIRAAQTVGIKGVVTPREPLDPSQELALASALG